jgi:MFS family permease
LLQWRVNWDDKESLHNWVEYYDMHCLPKVVFGLVGASFFMAIVISAMTLPRLADIIGRKKVFTFGLWLHTIVLTIILMSDSLKLTFVMLLLEGIASGAKAYVGYVYLIEMMPFNRQVLTGTLIFLVDGLTLALASFLFAFVTKYW